MALLVETGAGLAGAESYCDVAYMRAYCDGRGLALVGVVDARLEQLLRQAGDFLAGYDEIWQGARAVPGQGLAWPRRCVVALDEAVADDVVPKAVKDACARLAWKALAGPLVRDEKPTKTKVKVGPIETEYDRNSPQQTTYVDVGRLLAPYLRVARSGIQLERA